MRADIDLGGRRVRVIGTHLDLSGLRRRDQIKAILAHHGQCEAGCPTVVLGDFNQWGATSGAMREFGDGWQLLDPGRSFPSRQPVARLDRIIASREWDVHEASVHHSALAVRASDHLPVRATLKMPYI